MAKARATCGALGEPAAWARRRVLKFGSTLLKAEEGSALIETAMVFVFIGIPLTIGTAEMGQATYDSIAVSNAAVAGAVYGSQSTVNAANTSEIQSVAQAEGADAGATITVTPTVFYVCSNSITGTQYSTQSSANSACTGTGVRALEFIGVATSATVLPAVKLSGLATSFTFHGYSAMEVAQ